MFNKIIIYFLFIVSFLISTTRIWGVDKINQNFAYCENIEGTEFQKIQFYLEHDDRGNSVVKIKLIEFDENNSERTYLFYRHVSELITHDYWEYSNNYDFELKILPGQTGLFNGKLRGIQFNSSPLKCSWKSE